MNNESNASGVVEYADCASKLNKRKGGQDKLNLIYRKNLIYR